MFIECYLTLLNWAPYGCRAMYTMDMCMLIHIHGCKTYTYMCVCFCRCVLSMQFFFLLHFRHSGHVIASCDCHVYI